MKIWLIRHGEKGSNTGNIANIELTEKGRRQADLAGKRLMNESVDIIFSSTMTRARQTSDEINKYLNVKVEYRDELKEIDMGEFDRHDREYVLNKYPNFKSEFERHETDMPYPNGECGGDVWLRAGKVFDEILVSGFKNVAVIAHAGTIRAIICGTLGLQQEKRFGFGNPPEHCSITLLNYVNGFYYLHIFNDYSHLGLEL